MDSTVALVACSIIGFVVGGPFAIWAALWAANQALIQYDELTSGWRSRNE